MSVPEHLRAPAIRLFELVEINGRTECWPFLGSITTEGYGRLGFGGNVFAAHRLSYQALVGQIPDGLEIDHLCFTRACVNPLHLEVVTKAENLRRIPKEHRDRACIRRLPRTELGARLREARIAAGLTQAGLESWAGVATALVTRIESGRSGRPQRRTLERLAFTLDIGIHQLTGEDAENPSLSSHSS